MFQSTRPRGARRANARALLPMLCFNPRARVGRDVDPPAQLDLVRVSIHAPAWGATCLQSISSRSQTFQSTRPRGARHENRNCVGEIESFNPRARVGRDLSFRLPHKIQSGFNPRARVGRDPFPSRLERERWRFNPRARVGRDRNLRKD